MVSCCAIPSARSISSHLKRPFAWSPGSVDFHQRPVIFFPDSNDEILSPPVLDLLLTYFLFYNNYRHVFVLDRRRCGWLPTKKLLLHLNLKYLDQVEYAVVLKPQGFFQRVASDKTISAIQNDVLFPLHVIDEPKDLFNFISFNQIPSPFGGVLMFDASSWVNFQIDIEEFQNAATELGLAIQTFVGEISQLHSFARISRDLGTFELDQERVDALKRRRWLLLRRLSLVESRGVKLRKRLREIDGVTSIANKSEDEGGDGVVGERDEGISSLDLPVDRSTQIIHVEQYIIQLSETRDKLRKFWNRYIRGLRNLKTIEGFESRYKKMHPLLGVWQSLVDSVSDYLPGRSGALPLLPVTRFSDPSLLGLCETSEETDSFVVVANEEEDMNSDSSNPSCFAIAEATTIVEYPMEGLLVTQARVKEAHASAVGLLDEITELVALGETMRTEAIATTPPEVQSGDCGQVDKRRSNSSFDNLFIRLTLDHRQIGLSLDGEEGDEECEYGEEDIEDMYESEEGMALDAFPVDGVNHVKKEGDECHPSFPPPPLICLIPEYASARITSLRQLEDLARTVLNKAVSQLDRLVQLYTEINEARQWISMGNCFLNPLTVEHIAEMDPAACEGTIRQLNLFCDSKERNLVLKGNPGQFRKQFSDLLNAEMKVELSQMLRLVEEVEQALKLTVANLRQQISRNTYPIKPLFSSQQQQQNQALSHSASFLKQATIDEEQMSVEKQLKQSPPAVSPNVSDEKLYQRALQELLITEANHIRFLEAVTQTFSKSLDNPNLPRLPAFVLENLALLIVNLPEQLAFHKNLFYPQLLACNGDPLLILQWAESSWASLVDLYSNYCQNYERAAQYALAFEKNRIHAHWISAYNQYLNMLESTKPDDEDCNGMEEGALEEGLRKVASLNRVNSCIAFEDQPLLDINAKCSSDNDGIGVGAGGENEENLPPIRKDLLSASVKSSSLCRPLLSYSSRLLEPAQRFQRYHLLIDRLKKYASEGPQKAALARAHRSMLDMCDTVNVLMRIRGLPDHPSRLGRLLLQDNFTVWCGEGRNSKHQRCVFLFENSILLTKLRQPNNSLVSTVLATLSNSGASSSQSLSSAATDSNVEETGGCGAETDRLSSALPSSSFDISSQKFAYEIKLEILLSEVGLMPSMKEDQRRFAVWTARRAQPYTFQSTNVHVRTQWVHAINGLLSAQLKRIRDDVNRQHGIITYSSSPPSSSCLLSRSLRGNSGEQVDEEADVTVTDF